MPHLEELPQELFDLVLEELRPSDLPNLRLTSRTCAAKVLDCYATVHFTDCTIHCSAQKRELAHTLNSFLEIAQIKTFVTRMQSLIFEFPTDFRHSDDVYELLDLTIDERMKEIFKAIGRQTRLKHIHITSAPILGDDFTLCEQIRPLNLITYGLAGSGLEVAEMTIGGNDCNHAPQWTLPYYKLVDKIDYCKFGDVLQTLTVLRVSAWDCGEWDKMFTVEDLEEAAFRFMNMLSKAPKLKFLALLDSYGPLDDPSYSMASDLACTPRLEKTGFPALETLELENASCDIAGLVEFTKKYQLKKLILKDVMCFGFMEWVDSKEIVDLEELFDLKKPMSKNFEEWNPDLVAEADTATEKWWAESTW
ncbi:hypothetical protein HII31_08553 [Pseudocercospora fuligena]|uniref:F-box domain-containing protein n=1 Tax=Pseudocercospora fuligena TaxID=685502 RepID=A0A8H6RGQ2_9PEZI|nr:hypothetical protein HII31_08553 [Pseudocercospora fuligena]